MRPVFICALLLSSILGRVVRLSADILIFKDGSSSEVSSIEITDRAVHFVTLNGKRSSIIRDVVDVEATLAANRPATPPPATPMPPPRVETAPPVVTPEPPQKAEPPLHDERPPVHDERPPAPVRPPSPPPSASPPPAKTPVAAAEPRPTELEGTGKRHRFAVFVNGSLGTSPLGFTDSRRYELFLEEARIDNSYQAPNLRGVEIGGVLRIKGPVAVGTSVELFRNNNDAAYAAFLPHPFFFERYRELSGMRTGLTHQEQVLHLDGVVSKTWANRFTVDLFAGPSLFLAKTEVLVDVLYSEVYPYDAVIPLGIETQVFEDRPLGYNVGASATYRLAGKVGLDFGLRFSRARIRLTPAEDRTIQFDAGGLRAGAGLRLLFP